jgi:hypothetical protein
MDLEFITRNQVVERYLAGKLPLKGAQDFEQFCRHHPDLLDTIGLSKQVNQALRLLESGGKPEPWAEQQPRFFQRPLYVALVSVVAVAALLATLMLVLQRSNHAAELQTLQQQLASQPLLPAKSTRTLVLNPSRTAPSSRAAAVLNGRNAEMADLKIDVSWSKFANFRVLIDRVDQGRFAVLGNLLRDSNGQLRLGFNSTALGPGEYQFTLEGLDWRGTPEPQGWVTLAVER